MYPALFYCGTGVKKSTFSNVAPQLAGPVAGPVRLEAQFEVFYTVSNKHAILLINVLKQFSLILFIISLPNFFNGQFNTPNLNTTKISIPHRDRGPTSWYHKLLRYANWKSKNLPKYFFVNFPPDSELVYSPSVKYTHNPIPSIWRFFGKKTQLYLDQFHWDLLSCRCFEN